MAEYINKEPFLDKLLYMGYFDDNDEIKDIADKFTIKDVIEIPKGATNGDILKIIFPNTEWEEIHDLKGNKSIGYTNEFWNEPYKQGDEK